MKTIDVEAVWPGREEVHLHLEVEDNGQQIISAKIWGIGGPELLQLLKQSRSQLKGALKDLQEPTGVSSAALCVREVLMKAKGEWDFPYKEEELCHCRAVLTSIVDQAICAGAHTSQKVSELTSASTACGTCRPNVEAILDFRLRRKK